MGRLLIRNRSIESKYINLGKIIIFCEGLTEKYYLDYFSNIICKKPNKYNEVEILTETACGNAQAVLNYANDFLSKDDNNSKYSDYEKYLVFDCDAPNNIQDVIINASSNTNNYKLLISNYFFETWLLMHFENIDGKLSKRKTAERLTYNLDNCYEKANEGIIREIINNGDVEKAIDFSKQISEKYSSLGYSYLSSIKKMNPFSNLYLLIEEFLIYISQN